jgi:hypothetical protein
MRQWIQLLFLYQWRVEEAENALNDYDKNQVEKGKGGVSSFNNEQWNELLTALDCALLEYGKITKIQIYG